MKALVEKIAERARRRGAWLVTAESCTGGWVSQALTSVAGSSEWFERGFVTYSNAAKQELLGVRKKTLEIHGAVSEETASEMALGALEHSRGTLALAITGVAGPGGGTPAKPVGTVCFAWAMKGGRARAETRKFSLPRAQDVGLDPGNLAHVRCLEGGLVRDDDVLAAHRDRVAGHEIGREYNTRNRASRRSRSVRSARPCRSFDRVNMYNYDAISEGFPGR